MSSEMVDTGGNKYVYQRQVEYFQVRLDMPANKVDMKQATQKLGAKAAPQTFVWLVTFCWHGISRRTKKIFKNVSDTHTYPPPVSNRSKDIE